VCLHDLQDEHVVVSLTDAGKYGSLLLQAGVRVHCINMRREGITAFRLPFLWRIVRSEAPDAVQTWMYHSDFLGGVAARLAGCPRVFWGVHNTILTPGKSRWTTIWIARINSWLSRWVPIKIIYCAEKARQIHRGMGYDDRRAVVIPNGYDVRFFRPDLPARTGLRREWGVNENTPVIGLVARLDPQKDHDNLLAAIAILKRQEIDLRCVLVGMGLEPDSPDLSDLLTKYGLRKGDVIIPLGRRQDIPGIMSALDVHVLSSLGEAFPNVLCEAMACGTPCVTTDVGDAEIIVGDTGWVVPPGQPVELAAAIRKALDLWAKSPEQWKERQRQARHRIADRFDIARMVDAYRKVWNSQ
jgi:glycosyltransferase involved in cell wall biosynthesis